MAYPYWIGSQKDLQSRRAIQAGSGESDSLVPNLVGQDKFNPGQQLSGNAPNDVARLRSGANFVAQLAGNTSQFDVPLPTLQGQDTFFSSPGSGPDYDYPNPSFATVKRGALVAVLAAAVGVANILPLQCTALPGAQSFDNPPAISQTLRARQYGAAVAMDMGVGWDAYDLELIGQDQFPPGKSSVELPPRAPARARDYTYTAAFPPELIGQDAMATGEQSFDLPPRAPARSRDYSLSASFFHGLDGQDTMAPGRQSFELPPRAAPRARDYTIAASFPLELIGQDQFNPGAQSFDPPPRGAARASTLASDPGSNQTIALSAAAPSIPPGQSTLASDNPPRGPARARDYSQTAGFPPELIGQDAVNPGEQLTDLPPRGAARARDYTFTASFPLELIGQDQLPTGVQSQDLPPRGAPRARDYTFVASFPPELIGQDAMATGAQSQDLPPAHLVPRRAREYGQTASFPLELIGQDAMVTGAQLSGNAPIGPRRASTLSDPGQNQVIELTAAPAQIGPGLSTDLTALPPRTAPRARDYSFTYSTFPALIGKDTVYGAQGEVPAYDWQNPRGPARARDYTFTGSYALELIGQDQLPAGAQLSGNAPAGPRRAVDYSITASFPLELIGQDQLPAGAQSFELPPRAPARARDYTFTGSYTLALIGKDQLPVGAQLSGNAPSGPRRASTLSDPGVNTLAAQPVIAPVGAQSFDLPPKGVARAREYGQASGFPLELIGKDQLPAGQSTLSTELPPRGPARARDYTFTDAYTLSLIGRDALPVGRSTLATDLPPRATARLRDYSHLQIPPRNSAPFRDARIVLGNLTERWTIGYPYAHWTLQAPQ